MLVQAQKQAGRGVRVMPPLYVYSAKNGAYSPELQRMYETGPEAGDSPAPDAVEDGG